MRYRPRKSGMRLLLCAALMVSTLGCATTNDVKNAVAASNAAAAGHWIDNTQGTTGNGWKEPVAQIDRIIVQNSDQKTLVNHLRVRQAMLLTVYRQRNLAQERWRQVEQNELKSERDKSLYESKETLVWWYGRASGGPLSPDELDRAREYAGQLARVLDNVGDTELLVYLGTIRAHILLKRANDSNVQTPELRASLSEEMAESLRYYVELFPVGDSEWVRANPDTDLSDGADISEFRRRIWLRKMIKDYQQVAADLGLSPTWAPSWVDTIRVN